MKPRFIFWILRRAQYAVGMVAALALSSCAPAVTSAPSAPTEAIAVTATAAPADLSGPTALEVITASPTPTVEVQAVATSRGPNLEATDPTTVSLASGQLQLVEFFRFT